MSSSNPPKSQSEKGKIYRLKLDTESQILAREARRDSLPPSPVPTGVAMTEVEEASDTLQQAVSDQTEAVYLVVSKLDSTSERQERILEQQSKLVWKLNLAIVALILLAVLVILPCLVFLATQLPDFLQTGS